MKSKSKKSVKKSVKAPFAVGTVLRSLETSKLFKVTKNGHYSFIGVEKVGKETMFKVLEIGKKRKKLVPDLFFAETWTSVRKGK